MSPAARVSLSAWPLVMAALLLAAPALATPTPRAVVVGVGQYADPALPDLEGPPHDARAMRTLLVERFGFAIEDVALLVDEDATREAILRALARATAASAEGDPLVFYFSGHGARTFDGSGDEPDGWDEGLVPHDSGRDRRPNRDLIDDELHGVLAAMVARGAQVTFIYDACHSGTGTRDPLARVGPTDERLRPLVAPPTGIASDELPSGWTLVAAARQDQLAFEKPIGLAGQRRGLLTWTLIEALRAAPADATLRDVFEPVRAAIRQRDPRQDPQLEGPGADTRPFGVRRGEPPRYVLADPHPNPEKGGATIQAGAAHGVRRGAVYVIAPPGSRRPPQGAPVGRVLQIEATTAWVDLDPEIVVEPASRAFRRSAGPPDARLPVHVDPGDGWALAEPIRRALAAHPSMSTLPADMRSAARLILRRDGAEAVIETVGGETLDRFALPDDALLAVARALSRMGPWVRWQAIADLDGGDPLALGFTVGGRGGEIRATAGDALKLTVSNDSSADLYIHVLALGADGSVSVVYPLPGARAYVQAFGRWTQSVEAALPDGADRAIDRLKLIATSKPTDFRFLQQGPAGAGAKGVGQSSLGVLWATAGFGAPDTVGAKGLEAGRWAARELTIITTR